MKQKILIGLVTFLIVFTLSACNLPFEQQPTPDAAAMNTAIAQQVLLTQTAMVLNTQPGTMEANLTETANAEVLPTPTITLTPLPPMTATPQDVWLTITENSNCRTGPANYYLLITTFKAGDQVQAIGRNPLGDYYFVRNPSVAQGYCWVWQKYVTISGDPGTLPMFTPQPTLTPSITPTRAPAFSLSYDSLTSCSGKYALRIFVRNTGGVTWKSIRIDITDNTASQSFTHISNNFQAISGCTTGVSQADLAPNEEGMVSNYNPGQFSYDPTGHELSITVTLYSQDGYTGTSLQQSFKVTP